MKKLTTLLAVSGMVLALASAAQAGVTITPQDGYAGPYRLGFYTPQSYSPNTNDINWYNDQVSAEAAQVSELVALSNITWKCIGSTWDTDARDNTGTNTNNPAHKDVPIYNLNGVRIVSGNVALWGPPQTLEAPFTSQWGIAPNGEGTDIPGIRITTGTWKDGTKADVWLTYYQSPGFYFGSTSNDFPVINQPYWHESVLGSKMDIDLYSGDPSTWAHWISGSGSGQRGWMRLLALSSMISGGDIGTIVEIE